jgi:CRISPR system Cascade subunit CasE
VIASVLTLTRADCQALKVTDAYSIHRVVYSLFPAQEGQTRDFLFADKGGDFHGRKILMLSRRRPVPPPLGQIESKDIAPAFLDHVLYGFEVRLNPTKREKSSGKTIPIRGKEALLTWFCEKAPTNYGFEVLADVQGTSLVQVKGIGLQKYEKEGAEVIHSEATFIGKLQVIDRESFRKAFEEGMGRAKGFGFGLLQIVPLHQ